MRGVMNARVLLCPTCKKQISTDNPDFPFCSERCRLIDLGKWLEGEYAVPGEEAPDAQEEKPAPEDETEAEE